MKEVDGCLVIVGPLLAVIAVVALKWGLIQADEAIVVLLALVVAILSLRENW